MAVLALHDWDALEAIRTVLAERDAVEDRLRIAAIAMGRGLTQDRPASATKPSTNAVDMRILGWPAG
ncbi:hypothetical protein [Shinella sp. M31]|uniref:hypothetical protein n=1 Tax=Shinella sp. M31 TaxID=3368615 RepID=UPI003B9E87F0